MHFKSNVKRFHPLAKELNFLAEHTKSYKILKYKCFVSIYIRNMYYIYIFFF